MVVYDKDLDATHFLNVDLDLYASFSLQSFVTALGKKVGVHHVGRTRRTYHAHLDLARRNHDADSTIRAFCKLIQALPPAQREIWDAIKTRDFNIGVQAETKPHSEVFILAASTVKAAAALGARIVFTVYAPEQQP